jgi:hypothetical protein
MGRWQGVSDSSRIKCDNECTARELKDLRKRKEQVGHQLSIAAVDVVDRHNQSGVRRDGEQLAFHVLPLRRGVVGQGGEKRLGQGEHPLEDLGGMRGKLGGQCTSRHIGGRPEKGTHAAPLAGYPTAHTALSAWTVP